MTRLIDEAFADPSSKHARAAAAEAVAPGATAHGSGATGGPDGLLAQFAETDTRVPGAQAVIKRTAADGDLVAVHDHLAVTAHHTLFEEQDPSILDRSFDPAYLQHNPIAPNGTEALRQLFGAGAQFPPSRSVISSADGDLVWTFSQTVGAAVDAFVAADIFRVDDGLIREHWDVVPAVGAAT